MGATVLETVNHFMLDQANFLVDAGFQVDIFCSFPRDSHPLPSLSERFNGVTVHHVHMTREISPCRDVLSFFATFRLMRRLKPDVVLVGTPKAALLGSLAARMAGVGRRVYLVRGLRLEGLSGFRRSVSRAMERLTCRVSTHILAVSPSLREALAVNGIAPEADVIVLGEGSSNGVDTEFFRPPTSLERRIARDAIGLEESQHAIGYAGRLTGDKGIVDLLRAMKTMSSQHANSKLVIAGIVDGSSPLSEAAADLMTSDWCLKLGHLSDMRQFYWSLDVFCLPSHREGFPNVILEASSCGLPVVSTTATGCRDSVVDGISGSLVPPGRPMALMEALSDLVGGDSRTTSMGAAGRRRMIETFDRRDVWALLQEYLEGLLADHPCN